MVVCVAVLAVYGLASTYRFRVPTGAMMNTIVPGDVVLATRGVEAVRRGQVVVFQYPHGSEYYVSRIIGMPNETIDLRGTSVYINGRPLSEEKVMAEATGFEMNELRQISTEGTGPYRVFYDASTDRTSPQDTELSFPYQIPANSFFLMGDNRDNSYDSRYQGVVPRNLILGEARLIYFSRTEDTGEVRWNRFFKRIR